MTKFKYTPMEEVFYNTDPCVVQCRYIGETDNSPYYSLMTVEGDIVLASEVNVYPRHKPEQKPIIWNRVEISENQTLKHHLDISLVHLHKDEVCFVTKPITVNKHEAMKMIIDIKNHLDRIDAEEAAES